MLQLDCVGAKFWDIGGSCHCVNQTYKVQTLLANNFTSACCSPVSEAKCLVTQGLNIVTVNHYMSWWCFKRWLGTGAEAPLSSVRLASVICQVSKTQVMVQTLQWQEECQLARVEQGEPDVPQLPVVVTVRSFSGVPVIRLLVIMQFQEAQPVKCRSNERSGRLTA